MTALFLFCTALGAVLIGASFVFGDTEADADLDLDADIDADVDLDADADVETDLDGEADGSGDAFSIVPFGSLRFWTFLLEGFGISGLLLTLFGAPGWLAVGLSGALGYGAGYGAYRFFRYLAQETVSGDTGLQSLVSSEARVVLTVRPGLETSGKVVVETAAQRLELPATTGDKEPIPVGKNVLIAAIEDGVADVTLLRDLETRDTSQAQRQRPREKA